jgi:Clostridial hydrophobic W
MSRNRGVRVATMLMAAAGLASLFSTPANASTASAGPYICMSGHVQNIGWQGWDCSNDGNWAYAGTEGRSLRLEGVAIRLRNSPKGQICISSKALNQPWQAAQCVNGLSEGSGTAYTGTQGKSLPLEKFRIWHTNHSTCANGHVQRVGWQRHGCVGATRYYEVGVNGRVLERVSATVLP